MEDMCYKRRRAEACVDESAHHALANAGGREIVGKKECGGAEGGEGACIAWEFFRLFMSTLISRYLQDLSVVKTVTRGGRFRTRESSRLENTMAKLSHPGSNNRLKVL